MPTAQPVQDAFTPASTNLPAAHAVQEEEPDEAAKLFAAQFVHIEALAALYVPVAQLEQLVDPIVAAY